MTDTIDVTAEVMEQEISPISRAEAWLAEARVRVAELAAQYRPPEAIEGEREYKDAKQARSSVRKDAQELDGERKRMTREMDDALKRFRGDVKDVLTPLTDLDAAYKAALDEYEERWGQERRAALQEAYDEYAPDLVPLVPLDRLLTRYGCERGKGWLMRSTNIEAAKGYLRAAIDDVASCERTVADSVDPEDAEGAKADYFVSLDVGAAIQRAHARAEQRERVRRLEEERRAREAEYERMRAEAERIERERAEAERAEMAARAAETAPEATQAPEPVQAPTIGQTAPQIASQRPAPMPNPIREHIAEAMGQPNPGTVPPYVFCAYGSAADAEAFRAWCAQRDIKATVKPTGGMVYRITRK